MVFGSRCPTSPIKQRKLEANIQGTHQGIHDHLSGGALEDSDRGRFYIFFNFEAKLSNHSCWSLHTASDRILIAGLLDF